ncbi:MAG TPA: ATP-binding cassette domain-containing protein, partial [Caldimonas sp.]|nr:ATP-binding cassette domain-containing protein [Caldimonas sp.]
MEDSAYRLRGLRVDYGTHCALDVAALELPAGRITAVVGPNGAGKSTLLRVLAFLLPPTAGSIELLGRTVERGTGDLTALRRQVTYVAQAPLLFHSSVRANVAYGLRARGARSDERVDRALAAVGLQGFGERSARRLSGGETQRVAIARALAIDPPALLFDEPTANLDRATVPVIEALLRSLGEAGKTVVLTTHNLEQAYRLSHRVIALNDGRLAPSPLVNRLHGHTVRSAGHAYFESAGLRIELPDDAETEAIAIDADDIIVSLAPLDSSARNCFPGQIIRVAHGERGIVLTIDCGMPLLARITPHSYDALALNLGARVYVTFKASAIQ